MKQCTNMKIEDMQLSDAEVPVEKLIVLFREGKIEQLKLELERDDRERVFYRASFETQAEVGIRGLGITVEE